MNKIFSRFFLFFMCIFLLSPSGTKVRCSTFNDNATPEKVVYLTFDDGPGGDTTSKTLDILKSEGVPATFFIIGQQIKGQEDIILRMKNEGHAIGLHSSDFICEMKKTQQALYDVTGENYYILRFPFGSNNSTYRLTQEMVDTVHANNFKIYDWTQDTLDGANPHSSPDIILNRAISTQDNVVVLMHNAPANKNTASALLSIIKYYKSQGYTFKKITIDTPEVTRK